MVDKTILKEGIAVALQAREMTMSHSIKVGGALYSELGWQSGFNIERENYTSIHAEGTALMKDMARGLRWSDFKSFVVIYQDDSHSKSEIFPMCPDCWKWYTAFVDPQLTIVVADTSGKVQYECKLEDIKPPGEGGVYPSDLIRSTRPFQSFAPLGGSLPWQTEFHMNNSRDMNSLIEVALDFKDRGIRFDPVPQLFFDGVSISTKDQRIYGGYIAQTHTYHVMLGSTTALVNAVSDRYNGTDFEKFVGVVPDYVERRNVRGFLGNVMNEWSEILEFGNPNVKIIAVTGAGEQIYSGSLSDIMANFEETAKFSQELKEIRRRMNSEPRLWRLL